MKRGNNSTKWVVVTGGVLSGLGKGVVASSIGALLKAQSHRVGAVKIDPYINIDAGTMRPTVHGEVYVTFDGGETDQDLGNYERFLDEKISRTSNITTGQVYQEVIRKERNLEYGGSDVEVTKHIPEEIKRRLKENAQDYDVVMIEIGGTVGDYQNIIFLEAVRQMKREGESMVFVHVSYLPLLSNVGEMKTKPTQHSVRALNSVGINADFIIARGPLAIDEPRKEKISTFCNVDADHVISAPDVPSIYTIPADFDDQELGLLISNQLRLPYQETEQFNDWKQFRSRIQSKKVGELRIGIVGKYFDIGSCTLEDSYISVIEAIKSAGLHENVSLSIEWFDSKSFEEQEGFQSLENIDAVIVPGGFGSSGVEGKLRVIRHCREHKIPFLGLCYGLQLAIIEHARNLIGLSEAHTTEVDPKTPHPVIIILPEQEKLLAKKQYGNTMRLGDYPAQLKESSLVAQLYTSTLSTERHRHRFEVNPAYHKDLEQKGLVFSGMSPDRLLVEYIERTDHPFFVATQSHPEFSSRPMKPNPLFLGLIQAAMKKKQQQGF